MKYFTKEWYELSQKTGFHLSLEEDKRAETYSEVFFQQIYGAKLQRWLHVQEEVAALMQNESNEPFHREQAAEQFQASFVYRQEYLRKALPETILNRIADLRVFALDIATRDVIQAVTRFCEENERSVRSTVEQYGAYYKEASKAMDKEIVYHFGFHDCIITKAILRNDAITFLLDRSAGFTDIDEVIFEHAAFVKLEGEIENSWWLYEEVYKVDDKYEFHALLHQPEQGIIDFVISAERASYRRNGGAAGCTYRS